MTYEPRRLSFGAVGAARLGGIAGPPPIDLPSASISALIAPKPTYIGGLHLSGDAHARHALAPQNQEQIEAGLPVSAVMQVP